MRTLMLPVLMSAFWLLGNGRLFAQDDARAIITRAIQAHGGEERLARFPAEQAKSKGVVFAQGMKVPFAAETIVQLPAQIKNVLTSELKGKKEIVVHVLNGDKGWLSVNGQVRPLDDKMLAEAHETMYALQLGRFTPLLRDKAFVLAALGESKVNGRPALGVKISSKGHRDVSLFFEKPTGLMVKAERKTLDGSLTKEVLRAEIFSDFKEINGVKRPTRMVVFLDGQKFMEGEMTELKSLEKLDESVFAKP